LKQFNQKVILNMSVLGDEEKVITTIKMVMPAVVSVVISKHLEDLEKEMPRDLFHFLPGVVGRRKKKIFKIPRILADKRGMIQVGGGSGFIVDQNGIILTNKHVISEQNAEYTVITDAGEKYQAQVLSRDPINDVAILKIDASNLPIVKLGDASRLQLGQTIIAIGNALGIFKNTVSLGIVSGLSRSISAQANSKSPPQELRGLIQTDAAINPGNSGGPLVNLDGEAVGINTAIVFGAQNIGFSIPINAAKRDLDDIKRYGYIRRPFLGIRYVIIDEDLKDRMKLPVDYGALIIRETIHDPGIVKGSPAEKAGLREKDIILECNGKKVDFNHSIQDFLEEMKVGDTLQLTVLRNGKKFETNAVLAERK